MLLQMPLDLMKCRADVSSQYGLPVQAGFYISQHQVRVSEMQKESAPMIIHTKTADNRLFARPEAAPQPSYCCISRSFPTHQ